MEKHPLYFEELELEARYKTFGEQKLRQAYDKAKAEGQVGTTTLGQKFIAHQYSNVFEAVSQAVCRKRTGSEKGRKTCLCKHLV